MSRRISSTSILVLYALALSAAACDDGSNPAADTNAGAGSGGSGAGGSDAGQGGSGAEVSGEAIVWDMGGFVAPDANPFGIRGPFYFYSDCDPTSGLPCTAADASLTGPDAKPGWSADATQVCMKGTAVKVEDMMFAAQWGAGLALDLNSEGGDPGTPAAKGSFDAVQAGIRGFSVDIAGTAPTGIRINLTMAGLADSNFVAAKVPGTTTFDIVDAAQGSWITAKTPLDPTKLEAMQFQVFTNAAAETPYDFCITAIRAISDGTTPPGD